MARPVLPRTPPRASASGTPRISSPPTVPTRRKSAGSRRATSSGAQVTTARPPPSPNQATASSGSSTRAPIPAKSAASTSATASPPSAASCALVSDGGGGRERSDQRGLGVQVGERRPAGGASEELGLVLGAVEAQLARSGDEHRVALAPGARDRAHVLDQPDAPDHGRRGDRPPVRLVVERDVAGDDRDAERLAGLGHALDRLGELPGHLGLLRVAEVEAVRDRERDGAGARDVPRRLEDRRAPRPPAGRARRGGPARPASPRARGARAGGEARRRRARAGAPFAIRRGGRSGGRPAGGSRRSGRRGARGARRRPGAIAGCSIGRASSRAAASRRGSAARRPSGAAPGSRRRRSSSWKHRSSPVSVTSPIAAHSSSHFRQTASTCSSRTGSMTATIRSWLSEIMISCASRSGSRSGTRSRWTSTPAPLLPAISASDDARPAAPRSWSDSTRPPSTSSRLASMSFLPGERVADLDGRPLVLVLVRELLAREDAGAADAVAAGGGAVEDDQVADPGRAGARDPLGRQEPDAHRVHERVRGVRLVEDALAADGRHADRVPVGADSRHGTREGVVGRAEAEPVEERDRARAHGDDVAEDSADPGRRALERLDRGRMVVALDLEGGRLAVAQVDHACVLARALEDARAVGREAAQEERRMLVAAVLRPEEREDGQLERVRIPLEQVADTFVFPVRQAERAMERLFGDRAQVPESSPLGGRLTVNGTAPGGSSIRIAQSAAQFARPLRGLQHRAPTRDAQAWLRSLRSPRVRPSRLLACAPLPERALGCLVPLHQGRRRGDRAGRDDRAPAAARRARSCSRSCSGGWDAAGARRAAANGLARCRARRL